MKYENTSHRIRPLFVFSACRCLRVQRSLVGSLGLDEEYLPRSEGRRKIDVFLEEAQRAWDSVYGCVCNGEVNFIVWLRGLLRESCTVGVWIPRPFILRLRQLERGELVIENEQGPVRLPLHAGLPEEFRACCDYLGWNWGIVPALKDRKYESLWKRGEDETTFVEAVREAWKARPRDASKEAVQKFVLEEVGNAGRKIT